jgi:hypothetical protein
MFLGVDPDLKVEDRERTTLSYSNESHGRFTSQTFPDSMIAFGNLRQVSGNDSHRSKN